MILNGLVLREWKDRPYRAKTGEEVVPHTLTMIETGDAPMLQMFDYVLQPDELHLFGKMTGKPAQLRVTQVRSIFSGRVRLQGQLVNGDGRKG